MPPDAHPPEIRLLKSIAVRHLPSGNHRLPVPEHGLTIDFNTRLHRKRRRPRITSVDARYANAPAEKIHFWGWQPKNLSWWVPWLFTLGSAVWLVNGALVMWPPAELAGWGAATTALCGGFIFILGAYAAYFEVINRPEHLHVRESNSTLYPHHSHHPTDNQQQPSRVQLADFEWGNWAWWLNTLQLIGALVFFVACFTGLWIPAEVKFNLGSWYWLPQMVGAVFFMASSVMAMLEIQQSPLQPAWNKIGWYSAACNLAGAIGFFLCALVGALATDTLVLYWGSAFSTFWGSIAFLVSSYLMLLEVINPDLS